MNEAIDQQPQVIWGLCLLTLEAYTKTSDAKLEPDPAVVKDELKAALRDEDLALQKKEGQINSRS